MTSRDGQPQVRRGRYKEMIAFDIETLDKEPFPNAVTAAAVYDGKGIARYFVFKTSVSPDASMEDDEKQRAEFLSIMDRAPSLCSFNGIQFDIRFLRVAWSLPDAQIKAWVLKTFDVFEISRLSMGRYFSLSKILEKNQLESKSGSGADAIKLARDCKWEELGSYCLQDTKVTYMMSTLPVIMLPLHTTRRQIIVLDRTTWTLFNLY